MQNSRIAARGIALIGCGKMGSAMLRGWLQSGLPVTSVWVRDPAPSEWLQSTGVHLNVDLPSEPAVLMLAIKPQMMAAILPDLTRAVAADTVILSVAAGTPISVFEATFGAQTPIVRAMPNTPAAIGQGITAICANAAGQAYLNEADALLSAIGDVARLDSEQQMDAVTGVSGSGPAYVFHLIETLAAAGAAQGLPAELALRLAKSTVAGAGALALRADEDPGQLRVNVTSPNGTTQAALEVLMNQDNGFPALLTAAVAAATARSKELSDG
ncbi:MAG: pyrroline-5-carboxylate reductase [Pseudomonadota bacterium]